MTAPARPRPRLDRPPTREQLLVLADRAERGPLTPAEAARLRAGIAALYARTPASVPRISGAAGARAARRSIQLRALALLAAAARRRGDHMLPVALVEAALHRASRPQEASPAA